MKHTTLSLAMVLALAITALGAPALAGVNADGSVTPDGAVRPDGSVDTGAVTPIDVSNIVFPRPVAPPVPLPSYYTLTIAGFTFTFDATSGFAFMLR